MLSALLALLIALFQVPGNNAQPSEPPVSAEYPPQDASFVFTLNHGNARVTAAALLRRSPADVETLRALWKAEDVAAGIQSLRLIVGSHPERIADAAEALTGAPEGLRGDSDIEQQNKAALQQVIADARAKFGALPREDAARAERVFILLDGELTRERQNWSDRLARFIAEYQGTRTALLAEVDLIASRGVSAQMLDELDRFIVAHPETEAAAKALYQKGFQWHTINTLGTLVPRDADPTPRFLRVLEIVEELQSGRYPSSEWTEKAPSLIVNFFIPSSVKIEPGNIDLLIRHFTETARRNFVLSENFAPDRDGIGYLVTSKIGDLYERKGERLAGVERTLSDLEQSVAEADGVRLLRGLFYLRALRQETPAERAARLGKAREALQTVSDSGRALNHRRALATLAALEFEEGQHRVARSLFERYSERYPSSPWTWVARIRAAQCLEAEGQPAAAIAAYVRAADEHADIPMARVLGSEYAARLHELAGELPDALALHERALAGWANEFGVTYSSYVRRASSSTDFMLPRRDDGLVRKDALAPRIAELKRSLSVPGGASLEKARALVARDRFDDAAAELERMLVRFPNSPLASEARGLSSRSKVEAALALADVNRPNPDERAALGLLESVAQTPLDANVIAARIMRSIFLLLHGHEADASALLAASLDQWHTRQPLKRPANPLEQDVAGIRRAVFLPRGGEIYGRGRWNAFEWTASAPPFMLVNSDLNVKLHDGEAVKVSLTEPLADAGKLLFFDTETIDLLERMLSSLGGTKRREPAHIMETPNQPVGDSTTILALWQRFFPARPGHWGGWELETYPVITEIHFTNAARNKASVKVTIGYSGATVEMEKEAGRWIARRLTNQWIT